MRATDSSVYSIPSFESSGLSSDLNRAIEASERVPNRISLSMLMNPTARVSAGSRSQRASRRTSILLSEDLGEIDGIVDARFPCFRFERKGRHDTLGDRRQLEEVSSDDELRARKGQLP